MPASPLFGRRIHIAGSIAKDAQVATQDEVQRAQAFISELVAELVRRGANFVIPVDANPRREVDGLPICFDWLVWTAIKNNLAHRPIGVPGHFAVAVQHYKTESQIPENYTTLWDELRGSPLVKIENAAQWDMYAKRMEAQAKYGDILITIGGDEGVLYLANLYHDAGKPVVPLNLEICGENAGSRKLYAFGLASGNSQRLFRIADNGDSHGWVNKIQFPARQSETDRVKVLVELLEALEPPTAFAVRLLNDAHPDFPVVDEYFETVIKPVLEDEMGYRLITINRKHKHEHAWVDQEIFTRLHRSSVVIADLTGERPNCFLELGYALAKVPTTMVLAMKGTNLPFDISTFSGLLWDSTTTLHAKRNELRDHWNSIRHRPPLVPAEPLIA